MREKGFKVVVTDTRNGQVEYEQEFLWWHFLDARQRAERNKQHMLELWWEDWYKVEILEVR